MRLTVLEDLETCDRLKTIKATLSIKSNQVSDLINTKIYTEGLAEGQACSPPNTVILHKMSGFQQTGRHRNKVIQILSKAIEEHDSCLELILLKQQEKKCKLSMINTIIVIKNFFNEIISRLISVKERISELEKSSIK